MRLLLHSCCGPCATVAAEHFRSRGDEVAGWFFNPNVHPEEERRRREEAFALAARAMALAVLPAGPGTSTRDFLLQVSRWGGKRCPACYHLRLEAAACKAAETGFEAFSTTLLISPYQDLEAIREIGWAAGEQHGVTFAFADLRSRYPESCERSRELGLYRQSYCGCLFSELERSRRRARRALEKGLARAGVG
jgi:predicted adenine nucleotide alpha hydrolase (AANH) superfamily ATPase